MRELDIRGVVTILDDDVYEEFKNLSWFIAKGDYVLNTRLKIPLHRMLIDCPEGKVVDHINGNSLDNRRENLRVCTQSQNTMNKVKARGNFTSEYKGVHWDKQKSKWRSVIYKEGIRRHLGYFDVEIDAARSYNDGALMYHGEYAKINDL